MKNVVRRLKRYLGQPEVGAGLLYVALAFWILERWLVQAVSGGEFTVASLDFQWDLVSLAVSAWLAFALLRLKPGPRSMRRLLLVAVVHALGALRFHDLGLLLLAVLPVFALLAAWLLPAESP